MTPKRAPSHLSAKSKAWFEEVTSEFDLEPHNILVLTTAAESLDRAEQARKIVKDDGACVTDRFGQKKAHPMIAVERDARVTFLRALRELGLDDAVAPEARPRRRGGHK